MQHSCRKKSSPELEAMPKLNCLNDGPEDDLETYTVLELFDHLLNVCLKKQNICPNCEFENKSISDTWEHLRKVCPNVQLECDMCDQTLFREDFKSEEH